jgi:hypothetical protein
MLFTIFKFFRQSTVIIIAPSHNAVLASPFHVDNHLEYLLSVAKKSSVGRESAAYPKRTLMDALQIANAIKK